MSMPAATASVDAHTMTEEPLECFDACRRQNDSVLAWDTIFMLPAWVQAWHRHFGDGLDARLLVVRRGGAPVGIAPLGFKGASARLLGSADVCDYLDCIVAPGHERGFFSALFDFLKARGVTHLDLGPAHSVAHVMAWGVPLARQRGYRVFCEQEDATFAFALPAAWEQYLMMLSGKQRHEARRKLRRFMAAGAVSYRGLQDPGSLEEGLALFFRLFRQSRPDKAAFLTPARQAFFSDLARALSAAGMLHIGVVTLDGTPAAAVFCCDYRGTRYLYNSGYDPCFQGLHAGFVCKLLSIKDAIERGHARYDFLKGAEPYKRHLGGVATDIYRCLIELQ